MNAQEIAIRLRKMLENAGNDDNWHKYGEGYLPLCNEITKLANELEAIPHISHAQNLHMQWSDLMVCAARGACHNPFPKERRENLAKLREGIITELKFLEEQYSRGNNLIKGDTPAITYSALLFKIEKFERRNGEVFDE